MTLSAPRILALRVPGTIHSHSRRPPQIALSLSTAASVRLTISPVHGRRLGRAVRQLKLSGRRGSNRITLRPQGLALGSYRITAVATALRRASAPRTANFRLVR